MTDKEKPGAAAAAHGLQGIDLAGRQINPSLTADVIGLQAAPLHIIVTPVMRGRKWRATLDGTTLCTSTSPLITSARILIAWHYDPNRMIVMLHAGAAAWSLRGRLGVVAATLLDGETALRCAKNGPPMRFSGTGATS